MPRTLPGFASRPPADQVASAQAARDAAQAVSLRLNKAFYETGDGVSATLRFARMAPKSDRFVIFVTSGLNDVEAIVVKRSARGLYQTERSNVRIAAPSGRARVHDGQLEVKPGDLVTGLLFADPALAPVGARVVADLALAGSRAPALPPVTLFGPGMSEAEQASRSTETPFGTLLAQGDPPVSIALGEVLFTPNGVYDLDSFLAYSGGTVAGQLTSQAGNASEPSTTYLVRVPLARARVDRLADLRALFAESGPLAASQVGALQTAALIQEYRLKGFAVAANPRLQQHGAPSSTEMASGALVNGDSPAASDRVSNRSMIPTDRTGGDCASTDLECPLNVPRLWAHMALWDLTDRRVPVAFLDQGFATANPDFRRQAPVTGGMVECDFERLGEPRCGPGAANGVPIVAASGVGAQVWHGTGSVTVAGGVLNNAWIPGTRTPAPGGSAGVAGQVMQPMLYRMGWGAYAFRTGEAIRRAVDDGAACINIAAGYPCTLRLTLVGDFDHCNPGARAAACGLILGATASATAAATGAACATSGLFGFLDAVLPGLGSVLGVSTCASATAAAASSLTIATTACTAIVALGDVAGPMRSAVAYATERGVPIIASAGNQLSIESLAPDVRPIIDPSLFSLNSDQLRIIPATLPNVISVGAWGPTRSGFANTQLRGASVLVWAPEHATYLAPGVGRPVPSTPAGFTQIVQHGGTSNASSFVAGLVATLQAANPQLNPATPGLSAASRASIVPTVRRILAETATELGAVSSEPGRLTLVNPWAALQRAWGPWPEGFEQAMNFDESGADDSPAGARTIGVGTHSGTILTLAGGGGGAASLRDVDTYRVTPSWSSGLPGASLATFRVTLRYPNTVRGAAAGQLELSGSRWALVSDTTSAVAASGVSIRTKTYESTPLSDGLFAIRGLGDDDNVYTLTLSQSPVRGLTEPLPDPRSLRGR